MDYFTCLFLFEKLNFKRNKSHYYKIAQIKTYKQTNLKKGFKAVSKKIVHLCLIDQNLNQLMKLSLRAKRSKLPNFSRTPC